MPEDSASKGAHSGESTSLDATIWSRRDIFSLAGWAGFAGVVGASRLAFTRFMFPRVLFEPPAVFRTDRPENFVPGVVDERWKKGQRDRIVRNEDGSLYALLAICTHLGCTPNWFAAENKFKCPCHGSGFKRDGTNFEGPAPGPLDRIRLALTPEGILQVDKSSIFRMAPGNPEAQYPESILKV
jgi:cytochrome b6-f complex iron-sulfur subunit